MTIREGRVRKIEREGGGVDGVKERERAVGREGEEGGEKSSVCVYVYVYVCGREYVCAFACVCLWKR